MDEQGHWQSELRNAVVWRSMGIALMAAIAAGLNPYATLFLVAALATRLGFSLPGLGTPSPPVLLAVVAVTGLALPIDLVLGKLDRRRPENPGPAAPSISPAVPPKKAQALARAHGGVARVHLAGLVVWLLLAVGGSVLLRLGASVPGLVTPVSLLAATGHSLLLLLHTVLANRARRKDAGHSVTRRIPLLTLVRRVDLLIGSLAGALVAVGLAGPAVSPLIAAGVGAGLACLTGALLTSFAERARRSPSWVGLGHIPVLMAATTVAVIIIPLGLVAVGIGMTVALLAVGGLAAGALTRRGIRVRARPPETAPQSDAPVS